MPFLQFSFVDAITVSPLNRVIFQRKVLTLTYLSSLYSFSSWNVYEKK